MTMLQIKPGTFAMGELENRGFPLSGATLIGALGSPFQRVPLVEAAAFRAVRQDYMAQNSPHLVNLSRPFFMGDRKVTVQQFRQFMDDPAAEKPSNWPGPNLALSPTADCPVTNVSWFDALLFCNWLSKRENRQRCYERTELKEPVTVYGTNGRPEQVQCEKWRWNSAARGYRIATEAEWEYACRAGTVTKYSFGDIVDLLPNYAVTGKMRAQPGGNRIPNCWGVFDLHGNLFEWCWDRFGEYPTTAATDPRGPDTGMERIGRGGSHSAPPTMCASAYRNKLPSAQRGSFGFRVVCDVP
jgi:formylglycine-generating enzyme required for sulfatase activity